MKFTIKKNSIQVDYKMAQKSVDKDLNRYVQGLKKNDGHNE